MEGSEATAASEIAEVRMSPLEMGPEEFRKLGYRLVAARTPRNAWRVAA